MWVLVITKIWFFSSQGPCAPFGEVRIVNLREFSSENGRLSLQILENFELNILCYVLSSMYHMYWKEESRKTSSLKCVMIGQNALTYAYCTDYITKLFFVKRQSPENSARENRRESARSYHYIELTFYGV